MSTSALVNALDAERSDRGTASAEGSPYRTGTHPEQIQQVGAVLLAEAANYARRC